MGAAIYGRYSTDKHSDLSIAYRERVRAEYALKHGWTIAYRYGDEAISGAVIGKGSRAPRSRRLPL